MIVDPFKAEQTLESAHSTFSTRCEELSEVLQEREKEGSQTLKGTHQSTTVMFLPLIFKTISRSVLNNTVTGHTVALHENGFKHQFQVPHALAQK